MTRYRICVFGPVGGDRYWSHLLERNANPGWAGYRGTFEVEAKNARARVSWRLRWPRRRRRIVAGEQIEQWVLHNEENGTYYAGDSALGLVMTERVGAAYLFQALESAIWTLESHLALGDMWPVRLGEVKGWQL